MDTGVSPNVPASRCATSSDSTSRLSGRSVPQASLTKVSRRWGSWASAASKISVICRQRSGVIAIGRVSKVTVQPGASRLPIALDGRARDALRMTDLLEREPAEESQLRDPALSLIERGELGEGGVQIEEVDVWRLPLGDRVVERDPRPPARSLGHLAAPRVVHEDAPHHLGGDGEKMRPTLPIAVSFADQSKVHLVHEGGRLQDVPRPLAAKSGRRPAAKLPMDHRNELIPRGEIAFAPRVEQSGDVVIRVVQIFSDWAHLEGRAPSSQDPRDPALFAREHVSSRFSRSHLGVSRPLAAPQELIVGIEQPRRA